MGPRLEDIVTKFSSSTWSSDDVSISTDEGSVNTFKQTTNTANKIGRIFQPELQCLTSTKRNRSQTPIFGDPTISQDFITESREVISAWGHDTTKPVLQHRDDSTDESRTQSNDTDDEKYEELEILISKQTTCGNSWLFTKNNSEGDSISRVSSGTERFYSSGEESFDEYSTTDEYSDCPADYDTDEGLDDVSTNSTSFFDKTDYQKHKTDDVNSSLSAGTFPKKFLERVPNHKEKDRVVRSEEIHAVNDSVILNIGDSEFKQFHTGMDSFEDLEYLKKTDPLTAMIVADLQSVQDSMEASNQDYLSSSVSTNSNRNTKSVNSFSTSAGIYSVSRGATDGGNIIEQSYFQDDSSTLDEGSDLSVQSTINRYMEIPSAQIKNIENKKVLVNDMREDSSSDSSFFDNLTCVKDTAKTVSNQSKAINLSGISPKMCLETSELHSSLFFDDNLVYSFDTSLPDDGTRSYSDNSSKSSSHSTERYLPNLQDDKVIDDPPGDQLDVVEIHYASNEEDKDKTKKKKKSFVSRAFPFMKKLKSKGKKKDILDSKSDIVIPDDESIICDTNKVQSTERSVTSTPKNKSVVVNKNVIAPKDDASVCSLHNRSNHLEVGFLDEKNTKKDRSLHVTTGIPLSDNNEKVNSNFGINLNPLKKTVKVYAIQSEKQVASVYANFDHEPGVLEVRTYDSLPEIRPGSDDVIVKVEASTISKIDCDIRSSKRETKKHSLPITPGIDVVGYVYKVDGSSVRRLKEGKRVASLIYSGGNARYAVVPESRLVPVPEKVDASDAVCLIETYLKAFQTLQMGQPKENRYFHNSLQGKSILVIDGISNFGQAAIELATLSGAYTVHTTALEKHHDFLRGAGAIPLDIAPASWLPKMKGKMDIVIDSCCIDNYVSSWKATNENGKLICAGMSVLENEYSDWMTHLEASVTKLASKMMSRTSHYDLFDSWENDFDCCKRDLEYLFSLLDTGLITPQVANTFPLTKIARAQKMIESHHRIQGILVCEPWLVKKENALLI